MVEGHKEETLTIKKADLWKYSTFVLIAVVVIGAILMFSGKSGGNTTDTGTNTGSPINMKVFTEDPSLYPSLGPDDATNVVIEFADFQCPYCAIASGLPTWAAQYKTQYGDLYDAAGQVEDLAKAGDLRFIYVPWSFLGQESIFAAEAALCANEQGKFWEMHDAIFAASDGPSESTGKYSKANLEIIAKKVTGLDQAKLKSCLESDKYASSMSSIAQAAAASGVTGTPAFFVNGQKVASSWTAIQAALQ